MVDTYIVKDEEVRVILDDLRMIEDHLAQVKERKEYLTQLLYNHVNEHDRIIMVDENGVEIELATWKYAKDSMMFDSKRFQVEHKDMYDQYTKPKKGGRTLRIKHD